VRDYIALVRETHPGMAIDVPQMWRVYPNTGRKIVVKSLKEDAAGYSFETITGIRSRLPRSSVQNVEKLDKYQAKAEVLLALEDQCQIRGIQVKQERTELGLSCAFSAPEGKTVSAVVFFDLADFCARNGAVERLRELFDASLQRDPAILRTVHEVKADRMIDVFLYFVSIRSKADAKFARELLTKRYSDTEAYRSRVDKEVEDAYLVLIEGSTATAAKPPDTAPKPKPAEPKPVEPGPQPVAEPEPQPEPPPAETAEPPSLDGAVALSAEAPEKVRKLCGRADKNFAEAMEHIRKSDPNNNPTDWTKHNKDALRLLMLARDDYNAAQEEYGKGGQQIPQSLLNRFRETMMLSSMCRKRSVSSR